MAVHYGMLAKHNQIIAEYSPYEGDYSSTAEKLISQTAPSEVLKTFTQGNKIYSFFSENEYTYLCQSDASFGRELSFAFLHDMQKSYTDKYKNKAATFAQEIRRLIQQYSPEKRHEIDYFAKVEKNISNAVEVTKRNIEKVIERGGHMDTLLKKTKDLSVDFKKLRSTTRMLSTGSWKQKIKIYIASFIMISV